MKRLISVLLVFVLCLSVFPMSLAAEEETIEIKVELTAAEQKAIDMMAAFNLMTIDSNNAEDVNGLVTRAQFAELVINALNLQSNAAVENQIFDDVSVGHEAATAIETIYKMEIMKGRSTTQFAPEEAITFQEAVAALIRALGYEQLVAHTGGWFLGYYQKAKEIDLLVDVTSQEEHILTRREVALLLKNFMKSEVFAIIGVNSAGGVTRQTVAGETILSEYRHVLYVDDILTENQYTGLYQANIFESKHIKIGNKELSSGNYDLNGYLGYRLEVYYNEEAEEVVYYEISAKNNVLRIDYKKQPYVSNYVFHYTDNDKDVRKNLNSETVYIYNRKAMTSYDESKLWITIGDFELIDNNSDGTYDVVNVNNYSTGMIKKVDAKAESIILDNRDIAYLLPNYEQVAIYNDKGAAVSFSSLRAGNVLSILDNPDESFIEIHISTKSLFEKIVGTSEEDGVPYVTLESGDVYPRIESFFTTYPYTKTGDYGTFVFDIFGNIAGYQPMLISGYSYAYIIGVNYDGSLTSEELKIKYVNESSAVTVSSVASTVEVDGKRYKNNAEAVLDAITFQETTLADDGVTVLNIDAKATYNHLVRIKLNSDKEISHIDTTLRMPEEIQYEVFEPFKYEQVNQGAKWYSSSMQFDGKVYASDSCKLFLIPNNLSAARDEDFIVIAPDDYFDNGGSYSDLATYKSDPEDVMIEAIVRKVPITTNNSHITYGQYQRPVVISKVTTVVNDSGEIVNKISYYSGASLKEAYTKNLATMEGRGPGDVVMVHLNDQDEIDGYKLFYDYANNMVRDNLISREPQIDPETGDPVVDASGNPVTVPGPGYGYNYLLSGNRAHRVVLGAARTVYPQVVEICTNGKQGTDEAEYEYHRYPTMYLIENRNGEIKVSAGKSSDITGYESSPDQYSKILSFTTYYYDYDMFVYNEY